MENLFTGLVRWAENAFGSPVTFLNDAQIAARAGLMYFFGLALVRFGKNRIVGHNTAGDVLLGFMLGSLLSRGINGSATLTGTLIPVFVLFSLHWAGSALTFRSRKMGAVLKGESLQLVEDSKILWENMRISKITEKDLLEAFHLRGQAETLTEVKAAYFERNGEISVLTKSKTPRIIEVKIESGVQVVRIELQ